MQTSIDVTHWAAKQFHFKLKQALDRSLPSIDEEDQCTQAMVVEPDLT